MREWADKREAMAEDTELMTTEVPDAGDVSTEVAETPTETVDESQPEPQETVERESAEQPRETKEEPELSEFRGAVSARLRSIVKQAPELGQVFTKYPKLQEQVEAVFRREAALREIFPTVAEARVMRDNFPNGQADVQALLEDVKEIEELDSNFDQRDQEGNYPGHVQIISNFFDRDRNAAVSLLKTIPREWARLDRESYNEVMGSILGATLAQKEIPEFIAELAEEAKGLEAKGLEGGLRKLLNWAQGYTSERPKPSAEEERLQRDRQSFDRTKAEAEKGEQKKFHNSFASSNLKVERDIVSAHPAVKRLMQVNSISEDKRNQIVGQIVASTEKFLQNSPSFMRKLRAAYQSRNLSETNNLVKAAWSQPWLLNRMVRTVLAKEVPSMVQNNRETAARRAGTARTAPPASGGKKTETTKGPRQIAGRWYRENGSPFTTAEVLAGKHLGQ